jgi:pantoate--beta-alanine ligase
MYLQAHSARAPGRPEPVVVRTVAELRQALVKPRRQHLTIGLVPTMGALHAGHRSLIESARGRNDFVVVPIFVNPTQFGPNEDLTRYPRPFEDDLRMCSELGVDLVFHPEPEVIYPPEFRTYVEVTGLQDVLEGAARPGHFRGVATVVLKLFNLVQPDRAYFGQKDAQQARIVRQMVRDLEVPVDVVVCPIVREPDGLALSSRNRYLDSRQREQSTVLSRALNQVSSLFRAGQRQASVLLGEIDKVMASAPDAKLEHAAIVDPDTLQPVQRIDKAALVVMAVCFGTTRLIDNVLLEVGV